MTESVWSGVVRLLTARLSDVPPPVHALRLLVRTRFAEDDVVLGALAAAEADHGNPARLRELADVLERAATRDPQFAHQVGVLTGQTETGQRRAWNDVSGFVVGKVFQAGTVFGSVNVDSAESVTINDFHQAAPDALTILADQFAAAVGQQWQDEAQLRRVNDRNALPVPWEAADADLVEDWSYVLAATSERAGPWSDPDDWASAPADLASARDGLWHTFRRVPSGRLVVLGEPGIGKTILLVQLVLDLLSHRREARGDAVPVLLSLTSWNPAGEDLHTWLLNRLALDHAGLKARAPGAIGDFDVGQALLAHGLLLPILDGLDELPEAVRGQAVARINEALRSGDQLVVACRTEDYRLAIAPREGVPVKLRGAAGVVLRSPDADAVRAYLLREAGSPSPAADRWQPVLAALGTAGPLGRALRTPLLVSLANTVYNPRPGERPGALPDPAELCDPDCFPTPDAVAEHLFDAFVPAAYRPHRDPARRCRWRVEDAERYLGWLARHLEDNLGGTTDIAWWRLRRAAPRRLFVALFATVFTTAFTVGIGLVGQSWISFLGGGAFGLFLGYLGGDAAARDAAAGSAVRLPVAGLRARWRTIIAALVAALVAALAWGVLTGQVGGVRAGVMVGCAFGLGAWMWWSYGGSFSTVQEDLTKATPPRTVLARDRRVFHLISLESGAGMVLLFGGVGALAGDPVGWFAFGLAFALLFGLMGFAEAAWGMYTVTRLWLAMRGRVPVRFLGFLADAHEQRGVLRRVGSIYQFRHAQLQRRLATRA